MRADTASAGFYSPPGWGKDCPRLQILTIGELLSGKGIEYPPANQVNRTFPAAPRAKPPLFLDRARAADAMPGTGTK